MAIYFRWHSNENKTCLNHCVCDSKTTHTHTSLSKEVVVISIISLQNVCAKRNDEFVLNGVSFIVFGNTLNEFCGYGGGGGGDDGGLFLYRGYVIGLANTSQTTTPANG